MAENRRLTIKEYEVENRPIEKLKQWGKEALSDEELLSILIGSGTKKRNAVEVASSLLRRDRSSTWLLNAPIEELLLEEGIGLTKASRIIAGIEFGKRLNTNQTFQALSLNSPESTFRYLKTIYAGETKEIFLAILLDVQNKPLRTETISMGILDKTIIHPREVFRTAIRASACRIIVAHNHPSGDPEPSLADIQATKKLSEAGKILSIPVLDHMVIGQDSYVSFCERGLI